jgi:hypothetical protein
MVVAKQVADFITFLRGMFAMWLVWLGFVQGAAGIPLVAWALMLNWTGDVLDGSIARRSRLSYRSWIGDHDLQIDMLVAAGLMLYMLQSDFIGLNQVIVYTLIWLVVFWRWGVMPALGMLFQAPVYGWFIWIAIRTAPAPGWLVVIWIAMAVLLTWPRFPNSVVPGFLEGMRRALSQDQKKQ